MNWILVFISGLITYFLRYSMISLIKKDMLSEKTKTLLNYVPSAVFPALIFPAVLLENSGSFVSYDDPKIIAIIIAMLVGYFSYDIIRLIEKIPNSCSDDINIPDIRLMRPKNLIIYDNFKSKIFFIEKILIFLCEASLLKL